MTTRREFLKLGGAAGATLFFTMKFGKITRVFAQIPGGTLDPASVPKYQTAMLIPPVMPRAGKIKNMMGANADYYEISMKQFPQQVLPAGLPATTLWGYGAVSSDSKRGLLLHNAPSLTIEAQHDKPTRIKWINDLVDANGNYLFSSNVWDDDEYVVWVDLATLPSGFSATTPIELYFDNSSFQLNGTTVLTADFGFQAVPVPAAVWLFGSGLLGLVGVARRKQRC